VLSVFKKRKMKSYTRSFEKEEEEAPSNLLSGYHILDRKTKQRSDKKAADSHSLCT
jgi:tRNA G37 N-methylase TrmD